MNNAPIRFVMMEGVAGAGKSTLAEDLSAALADRDAKIDLIPEEAIFTRSEFAEVGRGFKTCAWPTADVMLGAYSRVIEAARLQNQWVIADWNCVGMIEDLPWAQPDRTMLTTFQPDARADMNVLAEHARDVQALAAGLNPILLVLNVPIRVAVMRAATERGQAWIERYAALVPEVIPGEPLIDRIVRWSEQALPHQNDIIEAYTLAGWEIAAIDAHCPRIEVLRQVMQILN